ncbi:MAG TPA: hypothetical protein DDW93_03915 [Firmicutes bacterium]|nr:hypothetical protein [Bacillota bacterium]
MSTNPKRLLAKMISYICSPPYLAVLVLGGALIAKPELLLGANRFHFLVATFLLGLIPALTAQDSIILHRLPLATRRKISFISFLFSYSIFLIYALVRGIGPILKTIALSYFLTVVLLIIVNFFYKASGHGSAVAGPVTALNIILPGCWGLLSIPLLALVAWARVTTKEHDLKQVLVGMVLGLVATLQSFLLIKPL